MNALARRGLRRPHGFTLVEVLVALGIVAVALIAGLQASSALTTNALRQSDVLLAHICAENELVKMRLSRQMPNVGDSDQPCEQAGRVLAVPLSAVRGTARQLPGEVRHTAEGDALDLDGAIVPYVRLARLLDPAALDPSDRAHRSVVLVEASGKTLALGVERLLGIESIVVRGVPELAVLAPIVSGASFDAEGSPRLVLSPEGLVRASHQSPPTPRAPATVRPPILVIDDSLTTRMLEQSILESAGYEVDLAVSGEEGMDKAKLRKYGLFLVDVEMPGMDGFTFIERTRADPELSQTPAILVTSRASPEDLQRGREVGAVMHIEKREFNQTDLLERIRKLVS